LETQKRKVGERRGDLEGQEFGRTRGHRGGTLKLKKGVRRFKKKKKTKKPPSLIVMEKGEERSRRRDRQGRIGGHKGHALKGH